MGGGFVAFKRSGHCGVECRRDDGRRVLRPWPVDAHPTSGRWSSGSSSLDPCARTWPRGVRVDSMSWGLVCEWASRRPFRLSTTMPLYNFATLQRVAPATALHPFCRNLPKTQGRSRHGCALVSCARRCGEYPVEQRREVTLQLTQTLSVVLASLGRCAERIVVGTLKFCVETLHLSEKCPVLDL